MKYFCHKTLTRLVCISEDRQNYNKQNKRMMRKIIVAMVLMLGVQMSQAQTVSGLFSEFRSEENAEYVSVPRILMQISKWAMRCMMEEDEVPQIVYKISSVRVLELSDCSGEVQDRFAARMKKLKIKGYEPLVAVKEDGNNVKIWGKVDGEEIRELVIGVHGDGDAVLCCIKGRLGMDDIYQVMEMK